MMKIGVYLGYAPLRDVSLLSEGLGRYLGMLVKILVERKHEITVACPPWLIQKLVELFDEYDIGKDEISFITLPTPALLRTYDLVSDLKNKRKRAKRRHFHYVTMSFFSLIFNTLIFIKHFSFLLLFSVALALGGIIITPPLLLFLLFFTIIRKVSDLAGYLFGKSFSVLTRLLKKFELTKPLKSFLKGNKPLSALWNEIIQAMRNSVCKDLVRKINKQKKGPDVWYAPAAYWKEYTDIKGVTVTCFPDLSTAVFAEGFSIWDFSSITDDVRYVTHWSKYIITYCDYQKLAMVVNMLGRDPACIRAVGLFVNDMSSYLDASDGFSQYWRNSAGLYFAKRLLSTLWVHSNHKIWPYWAGPLCNYTFMDMKYVFYSSQCRPNKNILTLVKAYEYLLKKKEVTFKLVLTGNLDNATEVREYVYEKRLQFDIVTFSQVSNQQLAALYACAELVVNSTLYEGGFLMIFSEGMSVGTPSVMSRIPQVTEVTDDYDIDDCLFNPVDHVDMANKILYGVQNREKLVKRQQPLYDTLSRWCKEDAGRDYEEAFNYFINLEQQMLTAKKRNFHNVEK